MKHGKGSKKTTPAKKSQAKVRSKAPGKTKSAQAGRRKESPGASGRGGRSATVTFSNSLVGNAFRRAVKKYPTALKRLTD